METTKIITSTKDFATALEQVEKIIDTKSSNYLLRSAFIQAEDGKMKISANNLDRYVAAQEAVLNDLCYELEIDDLIDDGLNDEEA